LDPLSVLSALQTDSVVRGAKDETVPVYIAITPVFPGTLLVMTGLGALGVLGPPPVTFLPMVMVTLMMITGSIITSWDALGRTIRVVDAHSERATAYAEDLVNTLAVLGYDVSKLERMLERLRSVRTGLNATLHPTISGALVVLPYVGPIASLASISYLALSIHSTLREHARRERRLLEEAAKMAGMNPYRPPFVANTIKVPDTVKLSIGIAASVATCGAFLAYVMYGLARDINEHVEGHEKLEAELTPALEMTLEELVYG